MEKFSDFRVIRESKDSIINKMSQLTDEQKAEAKAFFNKHNEYENEIDWNKWRTLSWEDLSAVIYRDRYKDTKSQVKKSIKNGLEGFKEGEDYEIIDEGEFNGSHYVAYLPKTWEASRMIASKSVEPHDTEARWCTAYQKDRVHWDDHSKHERFIYYCGEGIPSKKVAVCIEVSDYEEDADGVEYRFNTIGKNPVLFNIWNSRNLCIFIDKDEMPNNLGTIAEEIKNRFFVNGKGYAVKKYGKKKVEAFEAIWEGWNNSNVPYNEIENRFLGSYVSLKNFITDYMGKMDKDEVERKSLFSLDIHSVSDDLAYKMESGDPKKFEDIFSCTPDEYDDLDYNDKKDAVIRYMEYNGDNLGDLILGKWWKYFNGEEFLQDEYIDHIGRMYFNFYEEER